MNSDFKKAIKQNQGHFGINLESEIVARLDRYFNLVMEQNARLHLVGPCTPEEFAVRHVLESIAMTEYIPQGGSFADVGAGAGLPSIPCLLAREDLSAVLIESKPKKANFLIKTIEETGLTGRAGVINKQYAEIPAPETDFVACRALDGFMRRLPNLLKWAGKRKLLLFGGNELEQNLEKNKRHFLKKLLPLSEKRYLFIVSEKNNEKKVNNSGGVREH